MRPISSQLAQLSFRAAYEEEFGVYPTGSIVDPLPREMKQQYTVDGVTFTLIEGAFVCPNKLSFLYVSYKEDLIHEKDRDEIRSNLRRNAATCNREVEQRVIELDWDVEIPEDITPKQKQRVLYTIFKHFSSCLEQEYYASEKLFEGDLICVYPYGRKGDAKDALELGTKQRQRIWKRFGFGDVKADGVMYAIGTQALPGKLIPQNL